MPLGMVLMAVMVAAGSGQDGDRHNQKAADVAAADAAFVQAIAHADTAGVEKFLDAGFTWTRADGTVHPRLEVLHRLPKAAIPNERNEETRVFTYGVLADVQVNRGRFHVLRVWVKRSGGWKALVYQEVISLDAPPTFTPGAGKDCDNPCKAIPFTPGTETERQVALAYSKLETAARARNSAAFAPMVADEFVAASSNSDRLQSKRSRMAEFDRSKDAGVAPTPLLSARMFSFGNTVLMVSEHKPDRGNPLHVSRVWVKRAGNWVETLSYQTSVGAPAAP
ncbi:MAG TPA: DUF4440 domain-containing protein [Bryobacteraceae bacterium]|nr:DUF4440 domain-containing protein [Bryobacteraceae bacterium]